MAYKYPGNLISRPRSKNEFGCARQSQTDPNLPYFGFSATNYSPLNPGCDNGSGVAVITNTDCCNWDLIVGGGNKVLPGTEDPLAPQDGGKTRFGCVQQYQGNPNLPYYGWYAYNYDPLADGCDNGSGQPVASNTDCCQWDILLGGKLAPGTEDPLAPHDGEKTRFGCAHIEQTDPTQPYFGWPANNYDPLADGCDNGSGQPVYSNTDCCNWDLIVGLPKVGYTTDRELKRDDIHKEAKKIGCAQETNNDPNSPDFGCYHKPFYGLNAYPYDNPLFYHATNDGCANAAGWPSINNISCCECDIPVGLPKVGPGHVDPPVWKDNKWAFGCTVYMQNDPNLPYYGWTAMNYSSAYPGCDNGNGVPDPSNTDCCDWGIIVGSPRLHPNGRDVAPRGYHYMPDGTLMSDLEMFESTAKGDEKSEEMKEVFIESFEVNTNDLPHGGAIRPFTIKGSKDAVFSMEAFDADGNYYNFNTDTWSGTRYRSNRKKVKNGVYNGSINFSTASKLHLYTIRLFAETTDCSITKFRPAKEVRNPDGSLNKNLTTGSNSNMMDREIYQAVARTLTLRCAAPSLSDSGEVWNAATPSLTSATGAGSVSFAAVDGREKVPFTITLTAGAGKSISIERQPIPEDFCAFKNINIGSAGEAIPGEDVSAPSYYRWPVTNVAGLLPGMVLDPSSTRGGNVTAGTVISDYISKGSYPVLENQNCEVDEKTIEYIIETVPAITTTGPVSAMNRNGIVTEQAGTLVFNKQQVDALKDDAGLNVYGYGRESIKSLTHGLDAIFTNLKAEVLPANIITTTTTSSTVHASSTTVAISELDGIMDDVSKVRATGILGNPLVTNKTGATGAGSITLDTAVELESGATLNFEGASKIVTITGFVEIIGLPESSTTIYLDVERFLHSA